MSRYAERSISFGPFPFPLIPAWVRRSLLGGWERRSNATHQSTTDSEAKLAKKGAGKEAKLCYPANALMENRNGLPLEFAVAPADGNAERQSARSMLETALASSRRIYPGC
jgi:hypothetical protein